MAYPILVHPGLDRGGRINHPKEPLGIVRHGVHSIVLEARDRIHNESSGVVGREKGNGSALVILTVLDVLEVFLQINIRFVSNTVGIVGVMVVVMVPGGGHCMGCEAA